MNAICCFPVVYPRKIPIKGRVGPDQLFGKEVVSQLLDPCPRRAVLLTAPSKRAPPESGDMDPEGRKCREVGRHCMVTIEAGDDLPQPHPLPGDGQMNSPTQFVPPFLA